MYSKERTLDVLLTYINPAFANFKLDPTWAPEPRYGLWSACVRLINSSSKKVAYEPQDVATCTLCGTEHA